MFLKEKPIKSQRHFWVLYSFADLPVEFVSYLYEDFIEDGADNEEESADEERNGKKSTGAVYTPAILSKFAFR